MPSEQYSAGDPITPGSAVIEVHVRELSQLFNSMDPSPFLDKDLDVDAEEFIVSWAKELSDEKPLAILVHLDQPTVVQDGAKLLGDSVHTYFRHRAEITQRRLREMLRNGRSSLFIGLICLAASILLGDWIAYLSTGRFAEILRESLLIGGWVSMWRPMETFLYDWWPIRNERRIFDRLSASSVRIVCSRKQAAEKATDVQAQRT